MEMRLFHPYLGWSGMQFGAAGGKVDYCPRTGSSSRVASRMRVQIWTDENMSPMAPNINAYNAGGKVFGA